MKAATYRALLPEQHVERVPGRDLPLILMGGVLRCYRCGYCWTPETWTVRVEGSGSVCRTCALADPDLAAWQLVCDASDAIDRAMQAAADASERDIFRQHFESAAGHFAVWRWVGGEIGDRLRV